MMHVPKIVQQRLAGHTLASAHPDPDLLTAFAEKALQDGERGQVLAHLSQCADCREIVSLALPEIADTAALSPSPLGAWVRWPVLRWGALAACVVVVAVVGLNVRQQKRSSLDHYTASNEVALIEGANQRQALRAETKAAPEESDEKSKALSEPAARAIAAKPQRTDSVKPQVFAGSATAQATGGALASSAPTPAAPSAAVAREQAQIASSMEVSPADEARDKLEVQAKKSDSRTESAGAAAGNFARAKNAPEVSAAKNGVAATTADLSKQRMDGAFVNGAVAGLKLADKTAIIPRWTLSSDGTLQRSLDSGRTWQTIPVASQKSFRAVAALGSEIWVGGAAGSLYHSTDAGDHWTQVKPASGDKTLSADIIGIQFGDSQHGKLTTANGESWLTSDGGQTWAVVTPR